MHGIMIDEKEMEMYAKCMCVYGMRIIAMEMRNDMESV